MTCSEEFLGINRGEVDLVNQTFLRGRRRSLPCLDDGGGAPGDVANVWKTESQANGNYVFFFRSVVFFFFFFGRPSIFAVERAGGKTEINSLGCEQCEWCNSPERRLREL
jgi:hypothetical protein